MGIKLVVIADTALGSNEEFDNGHLADQVKLHPAAIRALTIRDMINKVSARAKGNTIDELKIFGHGYPGAQFVGGGFGSGQNDFTRAAGQAIRYSGGFLHDRALLMELSPQFTPSDNLANPTALVELHGCSVGKSSNGQGLVRMLAEVWNARVRAGLDLQVADSTDGFEGGYIEGNPLGAVWEHAFGGVPYILVPPFPSAPEKSTYHTVGATITRADWLSSLADKHYHDMLLWPIIFDKNKSSTFTNQNVMKPHQRIEIPPLPRMTSAEREAMRARGRNWK